MAKVLMKGNEAIAEAAVLAGCRFFFGYPITPQNQIPEYMSKRMPQIGGCFLQAESEVSAINMVYGASSAGARVMTSSSSPGISLKQEGISYIAASDLPCVIVNMVRGGPGLGSIQGAQGDYFQTTKGGGHGDYRLITFAPASVQEAMDFVVEGFDLADKYRCPVMILGDGLMGQMMEPVELPPERKEALPQKDWATTGWDGSRPRNVINSLRIEPEDLEAYNIHLQDKYALITKEVTRSEAYNCDGVEVIVVAYGTPARIAKSAIMLAKKEGIKLGLLRPLTVWPFPHDALYSAVMQESVKKVLTVEMSAGQLVEDVKLAVQGKKPVELLAKMGGKVPTPEEILERVKAMREG